MADGPLRGPARVIAPGVAKAHFERVTNRFGQVDAVLHRSADGGHRTVVAYTHPRSQTNLTSYPCPELAAGGIDALAFNNRFSNSPAGTDLATVFEEMALDVAAAVQHCRDLGYERVILLGWSAGGPLMAFYQHVAERGAPALARQALSAFAGFIDADGRPLELPVVDGIILRSATVGTAASFLYRLDGAVVDEETGEVDPALDMYDPHNGFDRATGSGRYTPEFLARYHRAQGMRMNRIVDDVTSRRRDIDQGRGRFDDDDVLVIVRTRANPVTVDLALGRRTHGDYRQYPTGASAVVEDVRPINNEGPSNTRVGGAAVHRLGAALSYRLVRVEPDRFDPAATTASSAGIVFDSTNNSTPRNLAGVTVPTLLIQGTGDESNSVKLPSAEINHAAAGSADKALVFIEGGTHDMRPVDGRFGDTRGLAVQVVDRWIRDRFEA